MKISVRGLDGKTVPLNVNPGDVIHVADLSIQGSKMNAAPCLQEQGDFARKEELRHSLSTWGLTTNGNVSIKEFCRLLRMVIPSFLDSVEKLALQLGGPSVGEATIDTIDNFVDLMFSLHEAKAPPVDAMQLGNASTDAYCKDAATVNAATVLPGRDENAQAADVGSAEHSCEDLVEESEAAEGAEDGNTKGAGDNEEVRRWLTEFEHVCRPWDVHAFFEEAPSSLSFDRSFMIPAVSKHGSALCHAGDSIKADKEVVLAAVRQFGCALSYAHPLLKANKEAVLTAVQQDGLALQYAHDSMRRDKEVALAAVKQNGCALEHAHNSMKANKEVVLAAVRQRGFALYYAHDPMKADKEVVLAAVQQDASNLACAHESMKAEKEVVLATVQGCGNALRHAHARVKADKEVVMAAVKSDGDALQYASMSLRADKEIILAAVRNNPSSLKYARGGLDLERLA